jgi:HD-GYP domain-containing protein (c-di-GMP phosphodiesterase class II)
VTEKFINILQAAERLAKLTDVDTVMHDLSRLLKKTVNSRWSVIYLIDRERRNFTPARSCGLPARYLPLFREMPMAPDKIPLLKRLLREKHYLLLNDSGASKLLTPTLRKLLGNISLLAVPMVVKNQVMGVAFVARDKSYPPFSAAEITLIKGVISQAALVASHSTLFDESLDMALEMGKRIDVILTLDEINKAISSSLSRDKIIATAMQHIERIAQCELVVLLGEEKGGLVVLASDCLATEIPHELLQGARPDTSRSCAATAFAKGQSCYRNSLKSRKKLPPLDKLLHDAGMQSLLAIPMVSKEAVNGVLLLGDTNADRFLEDDVFTIEKIAGQMAVALGNARLYEDMKNLFISTVASLANAIDAKSPWTKGHSERVMHGAANIARAMGLDDAAIERTRLGGLLHDIGKIGIMEAVLEKPEKLSDDDFPPMRLHPEKGVAILAPIEQLKDVLPGILHHHERYDGSGYPDNLQGVAIPLEARIIAVADAFDAMISERPYKKGYSVEEALEELKRGAGSQFDPAVVTCFSDYVAGKMASGAFLKK